jgi:RNA polymerase sigma-70 factor (ECF subfamily)
MTQTALLLAWKSIPQFEAGTHLKAWLVRILVNQVISERRRKKLPQMPLEAAPDSPGEAASGLESVLAAERQEEVRAALGTLDDNVRQAIVLRYFAEMSVPEIASALGWAEGTVKSRIHRGLAKLKEHFTETATAVAVPLREC